MVSPPHKRCPAGSVPWIVPTRTRLAVIARVRSPKCGIRTEKTDGCQYMQCSNCRTPWCWMCGEKAACVATLRWLARLAAISSRGAAPSLCLGIAPYCPLELLPCSAVAELLPPWLSCFPLGRAALPVCD
jgi:hypothetical protein